MHSMPLFRRCCLIALLLGFGACFVGNLATASAAPSKAKASESVFKPMFLSVAFICTFG